MMLHYAQLVIELVLGTDMKNHFAIIGHFSTVHMLGNVPPRRPSACSTGSAGNTRVQVRSRVTVCGARVLQGGAAGWWV